MFIFIILYHLTTRWLQKYCDLQTPLPLSCQRRISARWVRLQMIFFYYPADQTNYHPIPSHNQCLAMLSSDYFRRRYVTLPLFSFHLCFCRWSLIVIVLLLCPLCAGISLFLCDHFTHAQLTFEIVTEAEYFAVSGTSILCDDEAELLSWFRGLMYLRRFLLFCWVRGICGCGGGNKSKLGVHLL